MVCFKTLALLRRKIDVKPKLNKDLQLFQQTLINSSCRLCDLLKGKSDNKQCYFQQEALLCDRMNTAQHFGFD